MGRDDINACSAAKAIGNWTGRKTVVAEFTLKNNFWQAGHHIGLGNDLLNEKKGIGFEGDIALYPMDPQGLLDESADAKLTSRQGKSEVRQVGEGRPVTLKCGVMAVSHEMQGLRNTGLENEVVSGGTVKGNSDFAVSAADSVSHIVGAAYNHLEADSWKPF